MFPMMHLELGLPVPGSGLLCSVSLCFCSFQWKSPERLGIGIAIEFRCFPPRSVLLLPPGRSFPSARSPDDSVKCSKDHCNFFCGSGIWMFAVAYFLVLARWTDAFSLHQMQTFPVRSIKMAGRTPRQHFTLLLERFLSIQLWTSSPAFPLFSVNDGAPRTADRVLKKGSLRRIRTKPRTTVFSSDAAQAKERWLRRMCMRS